MLVIPDFSEVQDQVEAGVYKVRVDKAETGEWNTQKGVVPYINWHLSTFGEEVEKNNGRKIFYKTPLTGGGAFRVQRFYKAATGEILGAEGFDTEQLLGRELEVVTIINDKGYVEVKAEKALQ